MSDVQDLPPISPTGAMASGEYTDYMVGYDNSAEDVEIENLTNFSTMQTMEDWYKLWVRILGDVTSRTAKLEKSVNTLSQQITVIGTQLNDM